MPTTPQSADVREVMKQALRVLEEIAHDSVVQDWNNARVMYSATFRPHRIESAERDVKAVESAIASLRRAIEEAPGWQLVPKEPTTEMLRAGAFSANMNHQQSPELIAKYAYRAMLAARPQAPTAPAGADERLWCVNVHGPDDVYAMPNKAAALERANELNIYFGKLTDESTTREYDPIMRAVAIEWPHSAESHAADLAAQVRKED